MEKIINLLRERKPNFDENHILDMMYSEGTIFIKDGKPIYAYDSIIGPNTERMIINGKIGFIRRLVQNDKIDIFRLDNYIAFHNDYRFVANRELRDKNVDEDHLLMLLAISENPISDLISYLK